MSAKRVVIAMSGGVDSSVSAALLKEEGYEVIGVSLQLYDPLPKTPGCTVKTCCSLDDVMDAGRVARKLGIPFEVIDMRTEFRQLVIEYFITEYAAGRTPNPCIRCNELIKFDLLLKKAKEMGAGLMATGHYARTEVDAAGRKWLLTGRDPKKDQSYFLFTLTQEQLQQVLFPVGMLEKSAVRKLAADFNLPVAQKHESQEICFIPDNDYVRFLETHGIEQKTGEIVISDGTVVGRHAGLHRYTIGQRRGLGIAWSHPLHVRSIDCETNQLLVGGSEELATESFTAVRVTWNVLPDKREFRATCRIRYRHLPAACRVVLLPDNRLSAQFDVPQISVSPGQAAVFYDGERVLGGGWIVKETI